MTPPVGPVEVGIRELHDHLSRYVQMVRDGGEVAITMRGEPVARIVPTSQPDALAELRERGLIREPQERRRPRRDRRRVAAAGSVSELVGEQRR